MRESQREPERATLSQREPQRFSVTEKVPERAREREPQTATSNREPEIATYILSGSL